ncbi:MAG: stage V sporulation protein S [Thermomicrobiales bacterium]
MNRFFSKLDLRDIKIDPEGSRFPPDADDRDQETPSSGPDSVESAVSDEQPTEPVESPDGAWQDAAAATPPASYEFSYERTSTSASFTSTTAFCTVEETSIVANGHVDGATTNGSLHPIDAAALLGAEFIDAVDEVLKVSARSRPSAVAGAIAGVVRECGRAEVQAIGAGATNQAVKAVAIARDYLRETGIDAVCLPAFIDVTIENEDRTAIRLVVEVR